ncbi:hypothetical protein FHU37_002182 [Allostreptomyces psammosilenae]|uniref:YbjN domain-containing protein n=2 Tax=Allostreptomyces psammosilenae TaxID=1892865 RepID=A0A852ZSC5_9ACTN|nr:hypothetical protein [Allostreptomyces psammosilenae]
MQPQPQPQPRGDAGPGGQGAPSASGAPNPRTAVVVPNPDLVKQLLDQMKLKYVLDKEGDVVAPWEGFRVYFMFRGEKKELFSVRTFYDHQYTLDEKPRLLEVADEWNRQSLWPKLYTHTHDSGVVRLIGETQMVIAAGVNLEYWVTSTANWVRAAVACDKWVKERLGIEQSAESKEGGAEGGPGGDAPAS